MFELQYQYFRLQEKESLSQLNSLLAKGWEPVRETAFHASTAYTTGSSVLILLKRHVKQADVTVTEIPGDELDSTADKQNGVGSAQPAQPSDKTCQGSDC